MKKNRIFGILVIMLLGSVLTIPNVYASDAYVIGMVYDGTNLKLESDTLLTKGVSLKQDSNLIFDDVVNDKSKGDFYVKFWIGDVYMPQIMYFSPKKGNFKLEIPALSHIQRLEIYKPGEVLSLEIDIRQFAKCNSDKICQYELGENQYNCVADCAVDNPLYSTETETLFRKSEDIIKDNTGQTVLTRIIDGKSVSQDSKNVQADNEDEKGLAWDKVMFFIALILAFTGGILVLIFKKKGLSR